MTYTITAVDAKVDDWQTKQGYPMKTYRVRFQESGDTVVAINQKPDTPAPVQGAKLEGTINMSAPHGPKFEKEYQQKTSGFSGGNSRAKSDPKTMYVSYAKDVVVALIGAGHLPGGAKFEPAYAAALDYIKEGGKKLMQDDAAPPNNEADSFKEELNETFGEGLVEVSEEENPF